MENGRVNFDKTGFVNLSGDATTRYTYIQNGHPLPYGFSGPFYAELDGKTTWWQIEEGHCDYYGGPDTHIMRDHRALRQMKKVCGLQIIVKSLMA